MKPYIFAIVGKSGSGKSTLAKMLAERLSDYNTKEVVLDTTRPPRDNEKDGRNIPLEIEDIKNLSDIISQPDRIIYTKEEKGLERKMFSFLKGAEGGSYNLLEIYSDKKGNLTAKSFYKTKKVINLMTFSIRKSPIAFRSRTIS